MEWRRLIEKKDQKNAARQVPLREDKAQFAYFPAQKIKCRDNCAIIFRWQRQIVN